MGAFVTGDDEWSTLEVASADLGAVREGFENNFAWLELLVGSEDSAAHLQLVDAFDNASGTEAVYVDRLVVPAGSSLDLNGLNLYYRVADIAGQVNTSGGALFAVAVPEPTTAVLLSLLLVIVGAGRREKSQG